MKGFRIGGTVVNNLRYTDDTVIVAVSEEQLQRLINVVLAKCEEKGLHLNSAKSFSMVFSKSITTPTCHIDVHGNILEQVQSFIYVGSLFSSDARCEKEIRRRIGIAKSSFTSMNKLFTSRNIDMAVRIRVIKCYVWSTLLYGCEAWTLSSVMIKKLEAFETWLYRKMLRISWKDRITSDEVCRRMKTSKALLGDIVRRQLSFLGDMLRKDEREKLVVTGFDDGKRARGRQRETFLTYLGKMK